MCVQEVRSGRGAASFGREKEVYGFWKGLCGFAPSDLKTFFEDYGSKVLLGRKKP